MLIKRTDVEFASMRCPVCEARLYRSDVVLCIKCAQSSEKRKKWACDGLGRIVVRSSKESDDDVPEEPPKDGG